MPSAHADVDFQPHDLLRITGTAALLTSNPLPGWALQALAGQAWAVVRRRPAPVGLIAVGVRGGQRHERLAALVPAAAVTTRVRPEDLATADGAGAGPVGAPAAPRTPALAALRSLSAFLTGLELPWGPVGAVGFELATGRHVTHLRSDLDLIIRVPAVPDASWAARVDHHLATDREVKVDCLVETPEGAMALTEIASGTDRAVLRTVHGPRLITLSATAHPARPAGGVHS
ncbi:malonate decarboxylase holo-ACP synthase [Streptomyces sp. 8L]|uniref:malonate decarboxylase holo-ACP synthase n=1 Tax=Streptomyces sp. 8L TaxID=2877242 RepID=UPI001CD586AE|nr:malonate decarboxylase holo-ACP synthase [Streptomyces sp. 8L]MCA1219837.1 malonate decarboxylase holo-ACP synthase [Streptomyces sp. 8L]